MTDHAQQHHGRQISVDAIAIQKAQLLTANP
jgi:hypothetical protein